MGWLKPCGTVLIDRQRRKVRLFSFNINHMIRGAGNRANPACGHWVAPPPAEFDRGPQWANAVSLMVTWANLQPRKPRPGNPGWSKAYLEAIDAAIKKARNRGLAVILFMVQSRWSPAFQNLTIDDGAVQVCGIGMPPWLYPNGGGLVKMAKAEATFFRNRHKEQKRFIAVWKMLAARYKNNRTVVGAVPLSEAYDLLAGHYPGVPSLRAKDLKIADFYERVGRAIHRANPHLLQLFWDYLDRRSNRFALTRRPAVPNGVYGFEFYAGRWFPEGLERITRYQERGHRWGYPVTIEEFTAFNYTRKETTPFSPRWQRDTRKVLTWAKSHRVGWNIAGEFFDDRLGAILREGR